MGKEIVSEHKIELTNRKNIVLTGINNVDEFSDNRVNLKTVLGNLLIKGSNLTISRLNTDTGELNVSGDIDMIKYTTHAGGGLIEGLFK